MAKKNKVKEIKGCPFCGSMKVTIERKETFFEDYSIEQNGVKQLSRRYPPEKVPPKKKVAYCTNCWEFAGHIIYDSETGNYRFSRRKVREK